MTEREKLISKFGNPMEDARAFETRWMATYFPNPMDPSKDQIFPNFPIRKIYCNRLLVPHLMEVFEKLQIKGLLGEIKSYGGCWNPRYIRGYEAQKIPSIHTWALAVDFNVSDNPLGMTREQAVAKGLNPFSQAFNQVWRECGWVCGIDFKRGDGMHFQKTNI